MAKKKKSAKKSESRKVLYEKPSTRLFLGEDSLTGADAKELLGWESEGEEKFGSDFLDKDKRGVKFRCHNNVTNRPIYKSNIALLQQEILQGRWQFNFENRIIGMTGQILNGQHTFLALIFAVQLWEDDPQDYPAWETEPTIETSVGFGCPESDGVVNTMDTCKPRTLADVIYRSKLFADLLPKDRNQVSRLTDYAVKMLWSRTGACLNPFAPRRTHAESLDFIERHPKILACVKHVYEENVENRITRLISPGYAAALLYLMGSSETIPTEYRASDNPTEEDLDWSLWDRASDFWVELVSAPDLEIIKKTIAKLHDDEDSNASVAERLAILVKAWEAFSNDEAINAKTLNLEYETNKDTGLISLAECPSVGGIDYGDPDNADAPVASDPSPSEIASRAKKEREKATIKKTTKKKTPTKKSVKKKTAKKPPAKKTPTKKVATKKSPKKKKAKSKQLVDTLQWVCLGGSQEPFRAKVIDVIKDSACVKILQGFQGAGNRVDVSLSSLQEKQPNGS